MGRKNLKKKGGRKGRSFPTDHDPLFCSESRKHRKVDDDASEIESDEEGDDFFIGSDGADGKEEDQMGGGGGGGGGGEETEGEARKRIAEDYLKMFRDIARREKEEREEEEKEGERDSLIAQKLIQEHQEESGRVRRAFASRVKKEGTSGEFHLLVKHQQSVTVVALSEDDMKGFSGSKDGIIVHWDVNSGKSEKYKWPSDEALRSHGMKQPQGRAGGDSKQVLALAVSSDGRCLVTGGLDRHVHLWDTRTREHVQAFSGHKGAVSCLTFRQGTSELFSGSLDRTVKIWNVEDRTFMDGLLGHQSEVLTIDCLRKERTLTAGRDRTMRLFKVHEESQLIFRPSASSVECCCFVNNDEFLSGSDDGSIELWSVMRKKPLYIVKNAHAELTKELESKPNENITIPNESDQHVSPTKSSLSQYSELKYKFSLGEEVSTLNDQWYLEQASNRSRMTPMLNKKKRSGQHQAEIHHRCSSSSSWVGAVSVCRNSDLAASGAGNGSVRLWAIDQSETRDVIKPLYGVPLVGFVNSLAFAKSAEFLVAGVGEEPRLGRWGRNPEAGNGVFIHPLKLS